MPFLDEPQAAVAGGRFLDESPAGGRFLDEDAPPPAAIDKEARAARQSALRAERDKLASATDYAGPMARGLGHAEDMADALIHPLRTIDRGTYAAGYASAGGPSESYAGPERDLDNTPLMPSLEIPTSSMGKSALAEFAGGTWNAGNDIVQGLSTPSNLIQMGAMGGGAAIKAVVLGKFAGDMTMGLPEQSHVAAVEEPDVR